MWRPLRLAVLLMILGCVAFTSWVDRERSLSWRTPLWVGVFPVAADASPVTRDYIAGLTAQDFKPIASFMDREARRRGQRAEPIRIELYPSPAAAPPVRDASHGPVANVWWSLRLRAYAWRRTHEVDGPKPDIRLFVLYHDPARTVNVPHSVGLQKGLLGVVHAFASRGQQGGNQIVIAHELLHTLGATDKYDARNHPVWPDGYGDPSQQPRHPQRLAEIMAGRRAVDEQQALLPASLTEVVVGDATAREIRWQP